MEYKPAVANLRVFDTELMRWMGIWRMRRPRPIDFCGSGALMQRRSFYSEQSEGDDDGGWR